MPRLCLNFATNQRTLTAWNPVLALLILFAGTVALSYTAWDYQKQTEEKINLQDRRDSLKQRTQRQLKIEPISAEVSSGVERANTVTLLAKTPWEEIFTSLEAARNSTQAGIAMLSLKADTTKHELTLTGEAKDFTALSDFTSALSDTAIFQNITLVNDKLSSGAPPVVVNFDLHLTWHLKTPD